MASDDKSPTPTEPTTPDGPAKPKGYLYTFLSLHLPALAIGLGQGITTPVLPIFARDEFGVSVEVAAYLFVAQMLGGLAASMPVGYAIDRWGRRRVLLAGPIIVGVALLATATAQSFAILLVYRFIAGWGTQMWMLSRLTVIADGGGGSRARQITSMFGVQRLGLLAGPIIGGVTAELFGIRVPFILHGIVALMAVIPSFLVVQESNPNQGKRGGGKSASDEQFSVKLLLKPPIPILYTAQFFSTMTRGGAIGGGTVFLFGAYVYDVSSLDLAYLSSAMALAGIPLTLSAGYIMDRFGRKVTVVPGLALFSLSMVWFALTAVNHWGYWAFVVGFVWMQLIGAGLSGSMQTIGTDFAPPQARGRFFGIGRMVSQGGFMANPLSFSAFVAVSGYAAAFTFLAGTGLASAAILGFLIKESLLREKKD
ncbi:MAG: MFS transporter [Chloroflexi bacterium]|nr:MFS transporter [Chloroflexota bacterium]MDA1173161.1 MFS transporter [Chloroflexota bacterium]